MISRFILKLLRKVLDTNLLSFLAKNDVDWIQWTSSKYTPLTLLIPPPVETSLVSSTYTPLEVTLASPNKIFGGNAYTPLLNPV